MYQFIHLSNHPCNHSWATLIYLDSDLLINKTGHPTWIFVISPQPPLFLILTPNDLKLLAPNPDSVLPVVLCTGCMPMGLPRILFSLQSPACVDPDLSFSRLCPEGVRRINNSICEYVCRGGTGWELCLNVFPAIPSPLTPSEEVGMRPILLTI